MDKRVTLNGVVPSWADISFAIALANGRQIKVTDIAALNWKRSVEVGEKRGAGGIYRGSTRGQGGYEADAEFYEEGWLEFEDALAAVNASNMSLVFFTVFGQWTPVGSTRIFDVEIQGSRIIGDEQANAEGVDPTKRKVTFKPSRIKTNGRMLLGG